MFFIASIILNKKIKYMMTGVKLQRTVLTTNTVHQRKHVFVFHFHVHSHCTLKIVPLHLKFNHVATLQMNRKSVLNGHSKSFVTISHSCKLYWRIWGAFWEADGKLDGGFDGGFGPTDVLGCSAAMQEAISKLSSFYCRLIKLIWRK